MSCPTEIIHLAASVRSNLLFGHIATVWKLRQICAQAFGDTPYLTWVLGDDTWALGNPPVGRSVLRSVIRGARSRFAGRLQFWFDAARVSRRPFELNPSSWRLGPPRIPGMLSLLNAQPVGELSQSALVTIFDRMLKPVLFRAPATRRDSLYAIAGRLDMDVDSMDLIQNRGPGTEGEGS